MEVITTTKKKHLSLDKVTAEWNEGPVLGGRAIWIDV